MRVALIIGRHPYNLGKLGKIDRGETIEALESQTKDCPEFDDALKVRAIDVHWVTRFREIRTPKPQRKRKKAAGRPPPRPASPPSRVTTRRQPAPQQAPPPAPPVPAQVDVGAIARQVEKQLSPKLDTLMDTLKDAMTTTGPAVPETLKSAATATGANPSSVFIPSGLVDTDASAVPVEAGTAAGDEADKAAAALKKARKGSPKKPRKKRTTKKES